MNYDNEPELVTADIKNNELSNLVDRPKRLLKLRKVCKVGTTTNREPIS
jgi:hypothetical protein